MFLCFVFAVVVFAAAVAGGGGGGGGVKELVFSKHVFIHCLEEFSWEILRKNK